MDIILYETNNYIFYKDKVFSKQKQDFIKSRFVKRHNCYRVGITYMNKKYIWILLKEDYHLYLDDLFNNNLVVV
jgi:hypothetical protein